jgi:hypothetical protein
MVCSRVLSVGCFVIWLFGAGVASGAPAIRSELPAAERQKIEALIAIVEKLDGAVFVRNGRDYAPASAAKFLRGKWRKHAAQVLSADDFIEIVATRSSTTGRVYLVRFAGGREIPTSNFLRAHLATLR